MLPLLRFIHLRHILRLAARIIPPSCGDDPIFFAFFSHFSPPSIFACHGINALVKPIILLRCEPVRSHLCELQAIEFVRVGDVPNTTSCMCSTRDQVAHQQHALQPLL